MSQLPEQQVPATYTSPEKTRRACQQQPTDTHQQQQQPQPRQTELTQHPEQHAPAPLPEQKHVVTPHVSPEQQAPNTQALYLTPPKSDAVASYEDLALEQHPYVSTVLSTIKQLITCSACTSVFNRGVICYQYQIQLNQPIQCACGCVLCTMCYREHVGCRAHGLISKRALVNTAVSTLASSAELETVGKWALEYDIDDLCKVSTHTYVQSIMTTGEGPTEQQLESGTCTLLLP